jgi:hypothetical protein
VGDEVVVDFLDGDPDQPLVVGRVHNARSRRQPSQPAFESPPTPLRDRNAEIAPLAKRFCAEIAAEQERAGLTFSAEALAALHGYHWPGNVWPAPTALLRNTRSPRRPICMLKG